MNQHRAILTDEFLIEGLCFDLHIHDVGKVEFITEDEEIVEYTLYDREGKHIIPM